MNAILDWLDRVWGLIKARKAEKAAEDVVRGQEILDTADREAAEMARAAQELDATLNTVPSVPPAPLVPPKP